MKPSGEGLRLALRQLQVIKEKALYVGDSVDDVHAAKAAGVKVIILMNQENSRTELLSAGPDQLICHFNELLIPFARVTF
jgi:phosphoglycolate phosphatase